MAASPAEAARGSEAVFTMLSDDATEAEVTLGARGVATGLSEGAFHIASSSISVAFARKLEEEHRQRGQGYLSAPVFGRPQAAEAKKLVVAVGGGKEAVERFGPLFDAIGRRTFLAGTEPARQRHKALWELHDRERA